MTSESEPQIDVYQTFIERYPEYRHKSKEEKEDLRRWLERSDKVREFVRRALQRLGLK